VKSIEFIRPSGIGKSTFLNSFSAHSSNTTNWITSDTVLHQIKPEPLTVIDIILRKITCKFKPQKSLGNSNLFKLYKEDVKLLTDLFLTDLSDDNADAWQKIELSDYYFYTIIANILLIHHE